MLKKLYKYEFINLTKYLIFIVPFMFLSGLGSSLINKFITGDEVIFKVLRASTTSFYVISLIACVLVSFILVIFRYYRDLFMSQGYLSFTLPVENTDHYFCKLVSGVAILFVSATLAFVSLVLYFSIFDQNVIKTVVDFVRAYVEMFPEYISTIVIYCISLVFGFIWTINMFFTSITIGQQFKNRILAAIVAYIGIYMILQVIGTSFIFISALFNQASMTGISFESVSIFTLCETVILNVVAIFTNCYLLKNKLNLE